MEKDYILVGQGIAGSVLAFELLQRGKRILVVDEDPSTSSSKVAAGLYNPIVFKRLSKSWMVDELLPPALKTYASMEQCFNTKLHHSREIVKLFSSDEEKKFWFSKAQLPQLQVYLSDEKEVVEPPLAIQNPFGAAIVKRAGNVNIPLMLNSMQQYLNESDSLLKQKFNYADITFHRNTVSWNGFHAQKIIFCEGYKCTENPYFNWLPFVLTKGETLLLKIKNYQTEMVVNKGVFILPLGNDLYKVGATYDWQNLTEEPSQKGKEELLTKLKQILDMPFELIEHTAGIRPTVKDRRPILGLHPKYPELGIFNGMGTKSVMLAPYFAVKLLDFLAEKSALHPEVAISRFHSEYKP